MKTRALLPLLLLGALGLAGCSTVDTRIKEKPEVFSALTAEQQARIKNGSVAIGDSPDLVYIALGQPDARRERTTGDGSTSTWIYRSYRHEYAGTGFVGYRRVMRWHPASHRYYFDLVPVHTSVYVERAEDDIRVTFRDGKVTMIEQQT